MISHMSIKFFLGLLFFASFVHAAERVVPVRAAIVKRAPLAEVIPLTGVIKAKRFSSLSSQVDALVMKVWVDEGDYVKKGNILITLDKLLAEYDVKRAAAALEEAKARLSERIRKRDELKTLIKNQYLAKTAYETAVTEVRIGRAVVDRLQSAYKQDLEVVNQHTIKAPFAGVISKKFVESGQWIKVGNAVLELVDIDTLRVEVAVPQHYFSKLKLKTPVIIFPDALPGHKFTAAISHIVPVANVTAHTFPVHIEFNNKHRQYTPGMSARVIFQLSTGKDRETVLLVPKDALVKKIDQPDRVWVISKGPQSWYVNPVTVTTGRVYNNEVEILQGELQAGQQIVIRGNETLQPGQQVRLLP
jgi:membrane fusion protein, multidrug efflux system